MLSVKCLFSKLVYTIRILMSTTTRSCTHTHIQLPFSMPSQHMTRARVRMEQQKAEHDKMQALTKVSINSVCNCILHTLLCPWVVCFSKYVSPTAGPAVVRGGEDSLPIQCSPREDALPVVAARCRDSFQVTARCVGSPAPLPHMGRA